VFYKAKDDTWFGTQAERESATEPNITAKRGQGSWFATLGGDKAVCISDGTQWVVHHYE